MQYADNKHSLGVCVVKAEASGNRLSYRDTQLVLGMLDRGDRQHDIAAYFGVNGGRVAEVSTGECEYPSAKPAPEQDLPPPGPYITTYAVERVADVLDEAIEILALSEAEETVDDIRAAIDLARGKIVEKAKQLRDH